MSGTGARPGRAGAPSPAAREEAAREEAQVIHDLVQKCLAGDDDAFADIFKRYRDKVYRICWRFTRDHDEAMDLVQMTFIKVHRSLASYREESSFSTWIARVATNCGIDHIRSRDRQGKVELDESIESDVAPGSEAAMGMAPRGPAAAALDRELADALKAAVEGLSEKHRSVFVLHCVEGMAYQAIADTLEISIGTVMSRLFHARRYLRKALAPYLGEARVRTLLKGQEDELEATMGGST